jgi:glycosyltransferase involved in cell wall biosynthesis
MKLVSAIMPTRGRSEWARRALECFLAQHYPHKELIILDDAQDPSFMPIHASSLIRYMRHSEHWPIPKKRNQCCQVAVGEIICHWDSDDFSDPWRMTEQVELLETSGKQVVGYSSMLFFDEAANAWGRYVGDADYGLGTSLMYFKRWWKKHPFKHELTIGEDNDFVYQARQEGQCVSTPGEGMMVARVHSDNTSKKNIGDYRPVDPSRIPKLFFGPIPGPPLAPTDGMLRACLVR